MDLKNKLSLVAVTCSIVLSGCGSSSDTVILDDPTVADSDTDLAGSDPDDVVVEGSFFNAEDGLSFASDLGEASSMFTQVLDSSSNVFDDDTPDDDDPTDDLVEDDTAAAECDSGSISTSVETDANDNPESASIVFNDCVASGQTTTGSLAISTSSLDGPEIVTIEIADFATSGPEGDSSVDGVITLIAQGESSFLVDSTLLTLTADDETVTFSDLSFDASADAIAGTVTIGGQTSIASSSDGAIDLSLDPAFSGPEDGNPAIGVLTLTHEDGSSLVIDANTGDPDTFAFTINDNGSISTGIGQWDEDLVAPAVAVSDVIDLNF